MSTECHVAFIHSTVDRRSDCLQFLTVIRNDAGKVRLLCFGERVCISVANKLGLHGSQSSAKMPSDPCLCVIAFRGVGGITCEYDDMLLPTLYLSYGTKDFADIIKVIEQLTLR